MDILSRTPLKADHRVAYGPGPSQFGDLWLPVAGPGARPAPVVIFLHGGWWKSAYDLGHGSFLCSALRAAGFGVYALEYRRVGKTGGGWPATFLDAAAGFAQIEALAKSYPLDLRRVVVVGHSAGGHLAFWLAGLHHVLAGSAIEVKPPSVAIHAVVALAGAVDLGLLLELAQGGFAHDRREIEALMGGTPDEVPERYLAGDPGHLLPLNTPQYLVQGTADDQIPAELPQRWAQKAQRGGDHVRVQLLPGAEHMDVIDPESKAWPAVLQTIRDAASL